MGSIPSSPPLYIMTNISTERVYYYNTYLDKLEVKVLEMGQDENGSYVIFDKTIFYPKVVDSQIWF